MKKKFWLIPIAIIASAISEFIAAETYTFAGEVTLCTESCLAYASLEEGSALNHTFEINTSPGSPFQDADFGAFKLNVFNPLSPVNGPIGDPFSDNPLILDSTLGVVGSNGTSGTTNNNNEIAGGTMLIEFLSPPFNVDGAFIVQDLTTGDGKICVYYATAGCIPGSTEIVKFKGSFMLAAGASPNRIFNSGFEQPSGAQLTQITLWSRAPAVAVGLDLQIGAQCYWSDGYEGACPAGLSWESSNESSLTITATGLATGLGQGESTITASLGDTEATLDITVVGPIPIDLGSLVPAAADLVAPGSLQFEAPVRLSDNQIIDGADQLDWLSDNEMILTVVDGLAFARGAETDDVPVIITASDPASGQSETATITVKFRDTELHVGGQVQLDAIEQLSDGSLVNRNDLVTWTSSDETKATVLDGLVTGVSASEIDPVMITATFADGGVSKTRVRVRDLEVCALSVSPPDPKVLEGESVHMTVTGDFCLPGTETPAGYSADQTEQAVWSTTADDGPVYGIISNAPGTSGIFNGLLASASVFEIQADLAGLTATTSVEIRNPGFDRVYVQMDRTAAPTGFAFPVYCIIVNEFGDEFDITSDPDTVWSTSSADDAIIEFDPSIGHRVLPTGPSGGFDSMDVDIRCEWQGVLEGSETLTVVNCTAGSVSIVPDMLDLPQGGTDQLDAFADFVFAPDANFPGSDCSPIGDGPFNINSLANWSSSNGNIVTVDDSKNNGGEVSHPGGLGGSATIEAEFRGETGAATVSAPGPDPDDFATLDADDFRGFWAREVVESKSQAGLIAGDTGSLSWDGDDDVDWALTEDLPAGLLRKDPGSPGYDDPGGDAFLLKLLEDGPGSYLPEVRSFGHLQADHYRHPPTPVTGNVVADPVPGTSSHEFEVSGASYIRFSLTDEDTTPSNSDLDLRLRDPNGVPIDSDFEIGGSNVQVSAVNPMDGTWTVDVFGYDTPVPEGTDYTLSTWMIAGKPGVKSIEVPESNFFDENVAIAIGNDGFPVIAYTTGNASNEYFLKVAKCSDAACVGVTRSTLYGPETGKINGVSIAIGGDGLPIIAFEQAYHLFVAKCTVGDCSSLAVDHPIEIDGPDTVDGAVADTYVAIARGADGLPVIAYFRSLEDKVMLARCGDQVCTSATRNPAYTDESANFFRDVSLAIGTDDLPIIAFNKFDGNGALEVAHCSDAACSASTHSVPYVSAPGSIGFNTSIAVTDDGLPLIAHQQNFANDLVVSKCGNATCTTATHTTLDTDTNLTDPVMGIGLAGRPVIAYGATKNLMVARCDDWSCSSSINSTVDSTSFIGAISIAVSSDGLPIIAWRKDSNDELKVAKCRNAMCQ